MSTGTRVLKYAILPGFFPRVMDIFKSGFVHIAYMMAVIYYNVRLLPKGHPYLDPRNMGRYGMRHVIAEASRNLVFKRQNLDQIFVFFLLLTGVVLLFFQFFLVIVAFVAENPAYALPFVDVLSNPNANTGSLGPTQDLAFILMDRIFGIKGIFNSCISDTSAAGLCRDLQGNPLPDEVSTYPFPFHLALHKFLQFYSYGIFLVSVFILIYFVVTVIAETAQTGTPFGQRFNRAWVPIRLIVFFALLVPMNIGGDNEGLNGAQLITFRIVKMGSNFATNGWSYFNRNGGGSKTSNNAMSQQQDIVAQPNIPEVNGLLQAMYVANTCRAAYALGYGETVDGYIIRTPPPDSIIPGLGGLGLTPDAIEFNTTNFKQALDFSYNGNITIRFGVLGKENPLKAGVLDEEYNQYKGNVKPLCGDITLQTVAVTEPGSQKIQEEYYNILRQMWNDRDFRQQAECQVKVHTQYSQDPGCTPLPDNDFAADKITTYTQKVQSAVNKGIAEQRAKGDFGVPKELIERGWAGGGLWYNRIAAMNGAVTSATLNLPHPSKQPLLMETAVNSNRKQNKSLTADQQFNQNMADSNGTNVLLEVSDKDRELLIPMTHSFDFWAQNGAQQGSAYSNPTGNVVIDYMNNILGTSGLYDMRKNTKVHPLAQLSALGKGMIDSAITNVAIATAGAVGGSAGSLLGPFLSGTATAASGFLFAVVAATLSIGILLYYVLPFMPFIYFMFAVSGWVKSIFEAVVAMPLWALGHLRIDGEGLSGPGALNGYFLLLEIFLRPILTLFGLLASISIFAALVSVLNQIFDLVVANVGGFDHQLESSVAAGKGPAGVTEKLEFAKSTIDEFFYTCMYAVICYMMGLSSFKLVDQVPNHILRWMGMAGLSTFQENAGDPAGQLAGRVYQGTELFKQQMAEQADGMGGNLALLTLR